MSYGHSISDFLMEQHLQVSPFSLEFVGQKRIAIMNRRDSYRYEVRDRSGAKRLAGLISGQIKGLWCPFIQTYHFVSKKRKKKKKVVVNFGMKPLFLSWLMRTTQQMYFTLAYYSIHCTNSEVRSSSTGQKTNSSVGDISCGEGKVMALIIASRTVQSII